MRKICPLCNELTSSGFGVQNVGKNGGSGHIKDYFGPYSPYEEDLWPGNEGGGILQIAVCIF